MTPVSPAAEPCPPEAAACLLNGSKPVNLGRVRDGPQQKDGVTVLKYVDGDLCPDRIRKKSTTIRFTCSENHVVSDSASSALAAALGPARVEVGETASAFPGGVSVGAQAAGVAVGEAASHRPCGPGHFSGSTHTRPGRSGFTVLWVEVSLRSPETVGNRHLAACLGLVAVTWVSGRSAGAGQGSTSPSHPGTRLPP